MASKQKQLIKPEDDIEEIIEVGRLYARGMSTKAISGQLELSTRAVNKRYEQYKQLAVQAAKHGDLTDRITLIMEESLLQYDEIRAAAWDNKEKAETDLDFGAVNTSLRLIKDIVKDRQTMMSSMLDGQNPELLEELEEMERAVDTLKKILADLSKEFPDAAKWVRNRLRAIEGVEVV